MFAREFRLPASVSLRSSQVINLPFFTLRMAQNNLSHNRYGFIVGKSVDKRAVVRNRTKRRLRAVVEQLHASLNPGVDMLFIIKKEAVKASSKEFSSVLSDILKQQ